MDLVIDAQGDAVVKDCFISARAGDSRKVFRHGESCTLSLSGLPGAPVGRVDILKRIGSALVRPEPNAGCQDVRIWCNDGTGDVNLKVSCKLRQEAKGQAPRVPTQDASIEKSKAEAVEYLSGTDLQDVLTQGIRALLKERPADPRRFLSDWLVKGPQTESTADSAHNAKPFAPYTFKPSIGTWLRFLPDKESTMLPTEFEVSLDRSNGDRLGFAVTEPNGVTLQVQKVNVGEGLLGAWALSNRSLAVEAGDHILAVNSVRGKSSTLLAECMQDKPLRLTIKKGSAFNQAVDCQTWLQNLKGGISWTFSNQGRSITPCQELAEDDLSLLAAKYDADRDGKLSFNEFSTLARSDLWLMTKMPPVSAPAQPAWMTPGASLFNNTPSTTAQTGYKEEKPKLQTGEHLKLGVYKREDGQAVAALSLRYQEGEQAQSRNFVFTVTSRLGESNAKMWSATLEPAGLDTQKREMWRLVGHPDPSVLVQTSDHVELLECCLNRVPLAVCSSGVDGGGVLACSGIRPTLRTEKRHSWAFSEELGGMLFSEPVGLPLEHRSRNFVKAVIAKDPSTNEQGAPDTQAVVKQYARYQKTLPEGPIHRQIELLRLYTIESPLYHEMNKALRDDDPEKMKLFGAYIKELRDVFLTDHEYQIIKPFSGTVWRGIAHVPDLERTKRLYVPGKDFLWTAFTSTTTDKSVAMRWGRIVFEIKVEPPEGMYDDEVWEFAPADIKEFSAYASESEVLFPPNVKFRVVDVVEEAGKPLVMCVATALDGLGGQVEFGNDPPTLIREESETVPELLVKQLTDMGYRETRVRRALVAAGNDVDAAKKWLEEHQAANDDDTSLPEKKKVVLQRVQTRPKIGRFESDRGDEGRLCIQKGRCGKRRAYIFTVTESASEEIGNDDFWVARLVHKGHDPLGRDIWVLDGHPQGGIFLNDNGNFLERDENSQTDRRIWTFRGQEVVAGSKPDSTPGVSSPSAAKQMLRSVTFTWDSRDGRDDL